MKVRILVEKDKVSEPIISKTIYKTGAQFYIIEAKVEKDKKELTVEIIGDKEQVDEAIENLEKSGAKVKKFIERVTIDRDLCVDCGACVSLCPWYAIEIKDNWEVVHLPEKCIPGCELCVTACPVKALVKREFEV